MPIDPEIAAVLSARPPKPRHELPVHELRASMLARVQVRRRRVARIEDRRLSSGCGDIAIRLYWPTRVVRACLVYLHGGGFVMGGIETQDHICRELCEEAQCLVIAPEYRLAPEHPYPCALHDCEAVLTWIERSGNILNISSNRILLAGDSAGGNLAAVLALKWRDLGRDNLAGQILIYPVTDAPLPFKPSYLRYGSGTSLTRKEMLRFWRCYVGDADERHWEISPLRAERFSGLPPALILTAEYDPLRDEGEAYAERLNAAGVPTTLTRYEGAVHGFVRMGTEIRLAAKALQQITEWIRLRMEGQSARSTLEHVEGGG